MKKLLFLLAFGALVAAGIALLAGCDNDSTSPSLEPGDPNDADFEFVSEIFDDGFADFSYGIMEIAFELIDSIPGMEGPARIAPSVTLSDRDFDAIEYEYTYSNSWHIFEVAATVYEYYSEQEADTLYYSGIDSIQFCNAEGPMQFPDTTTMSATIIWHYDTQVLSLGDEIQMNNDAAIELTGELASDMTINGNSNDAAYMSVVDDSCTCTLEIIIVQDFNNIFIEDDSQYDCPSSGSLDVAATFDFGCEGIGASPLDSLTLNGTWNIEYAFSGDHVTISYSDGISQWTITEDCGSSGGPTAISRVIRDLKD